MVEFYAQFVSDLSEIFPCRNKTDFGGLSNCFVLLLDHKLVV